MYTRFKNGSYRDVSAVQNTAAHEYGHLLGIEDAYIYKESSIYSPKNDIMRWNQGVDIKMTNYDVEMMLRAYTYNKMQEWSIHGMKKRKVKGSNDEKKSQYYLFTFGDFVADYNITFMYENV